LLKVGLTGGIGSGKSTVAAVFSFLGIPIYEADARAKWLMNNNEKLKSDIIQNFGQESYTKEGLNSPYLSKLVFNNTDNLKQLNKLVHPRVGEDFEAFCKQNALAPYVVKEAAILFESGSYKQLDKIITVFCPLEVRIERVMQRDKISREEVLSRITRQMPEDEKLKLADYIIYNDGKQMLIPQVLALHGKFCGG
jgi:dephospho-CoA kinase